MFKEFWENFLLLSKVIPGFFKPRLSTVVKCAATKYFKINREYRFNRYPLPIRGMRWATTNPRPSLLFVLCLYLGAIIFIKLSSIDGVEINSSTRETSRDFWTVNLGILAVQAALVGVVFPLVIAFVGLLNQGRASFASRLTIYVQSSGALFVGFSSLILCIAVGFQLPFVSKLTNASKALTFLNIVWFALNVCALGYFVQRTIAFINPKTRAPIMRAYVANVIWPKELLMSLKTHHWNNVAEYQHLPPGDTTDALGTGVRAYTWYSMLPTKGDEKVSRYIKGQRKLIDIRFGVLAPVIEAWLNQVRARTGEQVHEFTIPLMPGRKYGGNLQLARATTHFGWASKVAIKASFIFEKAPDEHGEISETSEVLHGMIADLTALADDRHASEFYDQLKEVIDFHSFLYRLAQGPDENVSYAQYTAGHTPWHHSINIQWEQTYHDLIDQVSSNLPKETRNLASIAHVPYKIYSRVRDEVPPEALRPVLQMADYIFYRVIEWALTEARAEVSLSAGPTKTFTLQQKGEAYARTWQDIVGSRERLLEAILWPRPTSNKSEYSEQIWEDLRTTSGNLFEHLRSSANMVARAVWLGDVTASNWTSDLMLHWKVSVDQRFKKRNTFWLISAESLTFEELQLDWEDIKKMQLSPHGDNFTPQDIFGEILRNVWQDHTLLVATICIHWALNNEGLRTASQAARMLIEREPYDNGDRGIMPERGFSAVDVLISWLRISGSGEKFSNDSYLGSINNMLERFSDLGAAHRIPMRIYSSTGALSFHDISRAHAITLILTISGPQSINGILRRLLTQPNDQTLQRRKNFLETALTALKKIDLVKDAEILGTFFESKKVQDFDIRRNHAINLLRNALDVLEGYRTQEIMAADVDPQRIDQIAKTAGENAFSNDTFPRNFFDEIVEVHDNLNETTFSISGISKGLYTQPLMANVAINEDDWWREIASNQVADTVWAASLNQIDFYELDGSNPEKFWQAVRDGSAKIKEAGNTPILVMARNFNPEWWYEWQRPEESKGITKPSDLRITSDDIKLSSYDVTLNDTPVFRAPTQKGFAYLLPAELFRRLRVHIFENGSPIRLQFNPDNENPWTGTMDVSFQQEVELSALEAYRIRWN